LDNTNNRIHDLLLPTRSIVLFLLFYSNSIDPIGIDLLRAAGLPKMVVVVVVVGQRK